MKVIVGVGDSWTQGVGGVPLQQFIDWGGRVDRHDHEGGDSLYLTELENSWVNVLCRDHMPDHTPVNAGMRGYGNRGAVKNLHYLDTDWSQVSDGWLIFMLSGRIRFDYMNREAHPGRRRFHTLYPMSNNKTNEWYLKHLFTEHTAAQETMFCILEAQTFAKAHGLKFAFAYSFDNCDDMWGDPYGLSTKIDPQACINPGTTYFNQLASLDGREADWGWYSKQPLPLKHVTNCIHPTIDGYKAIAADMAEFMKTR